jgi:hypothetical protein
MPPRKEHPETPQPRRRKTDMAEDLYTTLRDDIQNIRHELHEMRGILTEVRVMVATVPKAQEVTELDKRLRDVERDIKHLQSESLNRRDYHKWLIPVLVSVASTLAVLGLKLWELLVK